MVVVHSAAAVAASVYGRSLQSSSCCSCCSCCSRFHGNRLGVLPGFTSKFGNTVRPLMLMLLLLLLLLLLMLLMFVLLLMLVSRGREECVDER